MRAQLYTLLEFAKESEHSCAASNANVFTAVLAAGQADSFGSVFWWSCSVLVKTHSTGQGKHMRCLDSDSLPDKYLVAYLK